MNWIALTTVEQLEAIKQTSATRPQIIFKHSTTCSISNVAKNRLDKGEAPEGTDFYYLDLLTYRPISNAVAEMFAVHHESPQVLLIKNGECTYEETHSAIYMDDIEEQLATA